MDNPFLMPDPLKVFPRPQTVGAEWDQWRASRPTQAVLSALRRKIYSQQQRLAGRQEKDSFERLQGEIKGLQLALEEISAEEQVVRPPQEQLPDDD